MSEIGAGWTWWSFLLWLLLIPRGCRFWLHKVWIKGDWFGFSVAGVGKAFQGHGVQAVTIPRALSAPTLGSLGWVVQWCWTHHQVFPTPVSQKLLWLPGIPWAFNYEKHLFPFLSCPLTPPWTISGNSSPICQSSVPPSACTAAFSGFPGSFCGWNVFLMLIHPCSAGQAWRCRNSQLLCQVCMRKRENNHGQFYFWCELFPLWGFYSFGSSRKGRVSM